MLDAEPKFLAKTLRFYLREGSESWILGNFSYRKGPG